MNQRVKYGILGAVALLMLSLLVALFVNAQAQTGRFTESLLVLNPGWNLVSVTPSMANYTIDQMSNAQEIPQDVRCKISVGWVFDNVNKKWLLVQNSSNSIPTAAIDIDQFKTEHEGAGIWLKVESGYGCRIGCGLNSCVPSLPPYKA